MLHGDYLSKKRPLSHQNGHARAHHAAMAFSEVAFVNGLGAGMRGECAVKFCGAKPRIEPGQFILTTSLRFTYPKSGTAALHCGRGSHYSISLEVEREIADIGAERIPGAICR